MNFDVMSQDTYKKNVTSQDEKDRRIRELSSELHRANQHLASCREQLRTFMTYVEEHTECLSRTVEDVVHKIREVESEDQKPSQYSQDLTFYYKTSIYNLFILLQKEQKLAVVNRGKNQLTSYDCITNFIAAR